MINTLTNFLFLAMKKNIVLIVALIVIGILGRIIPHPANFTPIIAIALLASHVFKNKWIIILIPLMAMWISDLVINNYLYAGYYDSLLIFSSGFLWIYGAIICIALLGTVLIKKVQVSSIALSSISGSLIFFLVTTTMDVDSGISRKLPPMPEENIETPEIHKKNIFGQRPIFLDFD